jgi:NADH dehydrogenase (ubiquinone) Fe-S protein 3
MKKKFFHLIQILFIKDILIKFLKIYLMNSQLIVKNIQNLLKLCPLEKIQFFSQDLVLIVKPHLVYNILLFLKYHIPYQFHVLTCISGIDYPNDKYRFKIVYELLSIRYNIRIRVKTFTHELLGIESCDKLYFTAGWYECEIWDMYGVFFKNHSNLKRILTDYGFEGHPLRKDFPLSGFVEMKYNETEKRVINESIELCQEYRTFKFLSPW